MSQVVNLGWCFSHVYILDENLEHTTSELPTEVVKNTLVPVKHQIQHAENPMPAMLIGMEAVHVDNAIILDNLTSEVALEEPEIARMDPNIPIDNNCTNEELHFEMPGGSGDYEDEGEESDEQNAIPTASRQQQAATELERFDLGTIDVDWYEGNNGDDVDPDKEEEVSQADDGSTQRFEDWGHRTRECEDWTAYFRPVKYDNGETNAMASCVSKAKTVL